MLIEIAALSGKKMNNKMMGIILLIAAVAVVWYLWQKRSSIPSCISGTALNHCGYVQGPTLAQLTGTSGA